MERIRVGLKQVGDTLKKVGEEVSGLKEQVDGIGHDFLILGEREYLSTHPPPHPPTPSPFF